MLTAWHVRICLRVVIVWDHLPIDCLFKSLFGWHQIHIKGPYYWPFVKRIHWWPVDSPHKRLAMRKAFQFHDAIITYNPAASIFRDILIQMILDYFRNGCRVSWRLAGQGSCTGWSDVENVVVLGDGCQGDDGTEAEGCLDDVHCKKEKISGQVDDHVKSSLWQLSHWRHRKLS